MVILKLFVVGTILLLTAISPALAGQAENITACSSKAKEFANISLDEFDATYEGNWLSESIVRWDKVECEVKFGDVYNLTINGKTYIYKSFPGVDAYNLNDTLEKRTEHAINNLKSKIALLKQRMDTVTQKLKTNNSDHEALEEYINEGIERSTLSNASNLDGTRE